MPGWADALFGGWTVSTLFQARSGHNLTPFFSGLLHVRARGTRPCPSTASTTVLLRLAAGPGRRPEHRRLARHVVRPDGLCASRGRGSSGTPRRAACTGPGTWIANFAFYKDVVATNRFSLQFSALLDNAFNHPQFFPGYGDSFTNMQSYLEDGDPNNGVTGVLGGDTIGNAEGFSTGRVIRLGIRATF